MQPGLSPVARPDLPVLVAQGQVQPTPARGVAHQPPDQDHRVQVACRAEVRRPAAAASVSWLSSAAAMSASSVATSFQLMGQKAQIPVAGTILARGV
jgi:hypothetical protein